MRKILILAIVCMELLFLKFSVHALSQKPIEYDALSSITSENEAIELAIKFSGFDKADGFSKSKNVTVEIKRIQDINIPFASDRVLNSEVWQVNFKNVPVGQQTTRTTFRDFEVLLDRQSGKLLMIYSISEKEGSSDTLPQPSKVAAENYFVARKYKFNGIPDSLCEVSFWEALQKVRIASPSSSKIIKAYYWDFSTGETHYPYAWLIIHRGMDEQVPTSHGNKNNPIGRNMMSCIDAMTGVGYFETTGPFDMDKMRKK
ncbi:MAG: hypothetical protein R3F48_17435 [Candidatus Zixiibacteriota bacterium]